MSYMHCGPCSRQECWNCEGWCECYDCAFNIAQKEKNEASKERQKLAGGYVP